MWLRFWSYYKHNVIRSKDWWLKILTDEEVKDFVAISFSEYFRSIREGQNLRKNAKFPSNSSWWSRKNCAIKFFW